MKKIIACIIIVITFNACTSFSNNTSISNDDEKIAEGEKMFNTYCSGCHNFRQNGIGPQLSGITNNETAEWIFNFIKNPKAVINANDKHALTLYHQYKTTMPSFTMLHDSDISNIIAFLNTHKEAKLKDDTTNAIHNPIQQKIQLSNLVISIKPVIQIPASSIAVKNHWQELPNSIINPIQKIYL